MKKVFALALFFLFSMSAALFAFRAGIIISARKDRPSSASPQSLLGQALGESNEVTCTPIWTLQLTGPNSYDLNDYQLRLDISSINDVSSPKFVLDGQVLPYCYEQPNGECSASPKTNTVWLRVSNILAGKTVDVCVSSGGSAFDGGAVFDFYDDFNDGVVDSDKWQQYYDPEYGNGNSETDGYFYMSHRGAIRSKAGFLAQRIIIEARSVGVQKVKYRSLITITTNPDLTADSRNSFNLGANTEHSASMYTGNIEITDITWVDGSREGVYSGDHTDGVYKLVLANSSISFYRDDVRYWGPVGFDGLGQNVYVSLASGGYPLGSDIDTSSIKTDWIRVRKYADSEVETSWVSLSSES